MLQIGFALARLTTTFRFIDSLTSAQRDALRNLTFLKAGDGRIPKGVERRL
jgi:hypothetical protein